MHRSIPRNVLICVLVLATMGCTHQHPSHRAGQIAANKSIQSLMPNVVNLRASHPEFVETQYGFGFIVGENWAPAHADIFVATARHILTKELADETFDWSSLEVEVQFYPCRSEKSNWDSQKIQSNAVLVAHDRQLDLALLKVSGFQCPSVSRMQANLDQTRAWRMGRFATTTLLQNEKVRFIGLSQKWTISKEGTIDHVKDHILMFKISDVESGCSGAPVINGQGKIVGMITNDSLGSNPAQATHIRHIKNRIESWKTPFDKIAGDTAAFEHSGSIADPEGNRPLAADRIKNRFGMRFVRIAPPRNGQNSTIYLQTTEVTQYQWRILMGKDYTPYEFIECGDHCPVEQISYSETQAFVCKLNRLDTDYIYRLPTEQEWRRACENTDPENIQGATWVVTALPPNSRGIYGMSDNVREWTGTPAVYPPETRAEIGAGRVVCGGCWKSKLERRNCSERDQVGETIDDDPTIGFRLVAQPRSIQE